MRPLAAVALLVLLAGCAQPEDEDEDALLGVCPQWAQGPGEQAGGVTLSAGNASASRELGPAEATHLGRPLDLYRVRVTGLDVDGRLELRAEAADGTRLNVRDYRIKATQGTQMVPVVELDASAEGKEFDLFLSPALHEGPAAPAPARLNLTLDGASAQLQYAVTFHYKVCGI